MNKEKQLVLWFVKNDKLAHGNAHLYNQPTPPPHLSAASLFLYITLHVEKYTTYKRIPNNPVINLGPMAFVLYIYI